MEKMTRSRLEIYYVLLFLRVIDNVNEPSNDIKPHLNTFCSQILGIHHDRFCLISEFTK